MPDKQTQRTSLAAVVTLAQADSIAVQQRAMKAASVDLAWEGDSLCLVVHRDDIRRGADIRMWLPRETLDALVCEVVHHFLAEPEEQTEA